ncbi:MAG: sugar phosphate isomerase/epimerase family protein [Planctomycetota bacterium]|jgi:sugar phosphate isomerase/epimerase
MSPFVDLGLKLWSCNPEYIDETVSLFGDGVFQFLELYLIPETQKLIESRWSQLPLPIVIHGPHHMHGLNLSDPHCEESNRNLVDWTRTMADRLRSEFIIFHPGTNGEPEETARQLKPYGGDGRILVENKPFLALPDSPKRGVANRPEEMDLILSATGLGFCLDVGHALGAANSHDEDRFAYLQSFIDLGPRLIHLADGDIEAPIDGHANLGTMNYPLPELIGMLPPAVPVTLETAKREVGKLDDFRNDVEYFRRYEKSA